MTALAFRVDAIVKLALSILINSSSDLILSIDSVLSGTRKNMAGPITNQTIAPENDWHGTCLYQQGTVTSKFFGSWPAHPGRSS